MKSVNIEESNKKHNIVFCCCLCVGIRSVVFENFSMWRYLFGIVRLTNLCNRICIGSVCGLQGNSMLRIIIFLHTRNHVSRNAGSCNCSK